MGTIKSEIREGVIESRLVKRNDICLSTLVICMTRFAL